MSTLDHNDDRVGGFLTGPGEVIDTVLSRAVDAQPWQDLPREVATMLRPLLSDLGTEIIVTVGEIPAYSRPVEGDFGVALHAGVVAALEHMVNEIEAAGPVQRPDIYRLIGRAEMRAGRTLDSLLSAYRIGARVAWRRAAQAGEQAGLRPQVLYRLAESIFAYIDMLSAESAEGHARERSLQVGEINALRRQLVRLLVRSPAPSRARLESAAAEAHWQVPKSLAVLVIDAGDGSGAQGQAELRLPLGTIVESIGELLCAIVPDPTAPGRRDEIERAMQRSRRRGALGTAVTPESAAVSFARAQATLALAIEQPLVCAEDLSGELLLARDVALAQEFAALRLSAFDRVGEGSRKRLEATLDAWLAEQGRLTAVAERLGIHPQTARYRLARLRELFGSALDDPEQRFWLALALRIAR